MYTVRVLKNGKETGVVYSQVVGFGEDKDDSGYFQITLNCAAPNRVYEDNSQCFEKEPIAVDDGHKFLLKKGYTAEKEV